MARGFSPALSVLLFAVVASSTGWSSVWSGSSTSFAAAASPTVPYTSDDPNSHCWGTTSDVTPEPERNSAGPENTPIDLENADFLVSPSTDAGSEIPNLKWPFSPSPTRLPTGGYARIENTTALPVAKDIAGADLRLEAGAIRELHWHVLDISLAAVALYLALCLVWKTPLLSGPINGLRYALNPCAFLSRCRYKWGPVCRVLLGSWPVVVFSSGDDISSIFSVSPQLLRDDAMFKEFFRAFAGVNANFPYLYEVMVRDIFPLFDRRLSSRSLGESTQTFGSVLLARIKDITRDNSEPISLTKLTNEPLYIATNFVLFGGAFPADTYEDFQTLNKSLPYRFNGTLLFRWQSYAARMRLLKVLTSYLKRAEVDDVDDGFSRGFMQVFVDKNLQSWEGAQLFLSMLRGIQSNTMNNSFFLLSFLLCDPDSFAQVRAEVDSAIKTFGSLEGLLRGGPDVLDDPSFQLLTSAIMETIRLTGLHGGVRKASCDFNLRLKDGTTMLIKEGECVFGNFHAAQMNETTFPNPTAFVVDRFAQRPYRSKQLQTAGYPFYSLGGGRHICKGRWLAIYEIKVLLIILLHSFDFSPAVEGSGWSLPRVHPRSVGAVHTEDDIFVRLSPRRV